MEGKILKHKLKFRFPAGTSRGTLLEKDTWYIKIWNEENRQVFGLGEIGPLKGLSPDNLNEFDDRLNKIANCLKTFKSPDSDILAGLEDLNLLTPSIRLGLETALLDLKNGGKREIFPGDFNRSQRPILINGLIWMNDLAHMMSQVDEKLSQGFECIKMKIGAIRFEDELIVLKQLRQKGGESLMIRVDANGAFGFDEAIDKLGQLEDLKIHSIEQPLSPGNNDLPRLIEQSPIPIALDEELIGHESDKMELLNKLKPSFIVLKPTLLGGFKETDEWINVAEKNEIGWWITSMLESNIGLNAIAQYAHSKAPETLHGLGTGSLYNNNIDSPLNVSKGTLTYELNKSWDMTKFQG